MRFISIFLFFFYRNCNRLQIETSYVPLVIFMQSIKCGINDENRFEKIENFFLNVDKIIENLTYIYREFINCR